MIRTIPITTLFLDIGGVLLTNGWDQHARRRAAKHFKLEWAGMEERHALNFETHEEGRMTFEEYLNRVIFHQKRPFTRAQFRHFMCAQSMPYHETIDLIARLKAQHGLKITVVSNESRELNYYRIEKYGLRKTFRLFVSSCFVGVRKPERDIYRLALEITQIPADECCFIDDRALNLECASKLGMHTIEMQQVEQLRADLAKLGVSP